MMAAQLRDYDGDGGQSVLAELERNASKRASGYKLIDGAKAKHVPSERWDVPDETASFPPDDMPSSFLSTHSLTHVAQCELQALTLAMRAFLEPIHSAMPRSGCSPVVSLTPVNESNLAARKRWLMSTAERVRNCGWRRSTGFHRKLEVLSSRNCSV